MIVRYLRNIPAVLLIGVAFLGASPIAQRAVLCLERDGRMHVETGFWNLCAEPCAMGGFTFTIDATAFERTETASCDACVDIPLHTPNSRESRFAASTDPLTHHVSALAAAVIPLSVAEPDLAAREPLAIPLSNSGMLRSTVLLI